jgi:hypothetical protein
MKFLKVCFQSMHQEKLVLFSSVLLLAACGSAPQGVPPIPQASMNGPINPAYCISQRGSIITSATGQQLCKVLIDSPTISMNYSGVYFPIITPSVPAGRNPYTPGITVRRNDRILFSGQSTWGGTNINSTSYLGGLFNFTTMTTNCSLISGEGTIASTGALATLNEGVAPGLMASDGIQAYLIGNTRTIRVMNDGVLRLGFNTPLTYASMNCGQFVINRLTVERCTDSMGAAVGCP